VPPSRRRSTRAPAAAFMRAAGVARFAWNWALGEYKRREEAQEPVDWNELKKTFRARIDAEVKRFHDEAGAEGIAVAISNG